MKRKHLKKKIGSLVLAAAMIITSFPAFSEEVQATEIKISEAGPSVTAFAAKDQLMTEFKPDTNGNSDTIGKLAFGKNSNNEVQNWYILGKDDGVDGDNTVLFATDPIKRSQEFNSDASSYKTYIPAPNTTGYEEKTEPITVYANHYGASEFYEQLNEIAENTNYFAAVEQGLMNKTTVTTHDEKNNVDYTTVDRLYALTADSKGSTYIKAGSSDQIVLAMEKYWKSGSTFWLRKADIKPNVVLAADTNYQVSVASANAPRVLRPALSLNLSSVLFASAAKAASSTTAETGVIAADAVMTLRLNGNDQNIGTVIYDTTSGGIEAQKAANATGTVSLVVQGNDGTEDWYYSKSVQAGESTVVTKSQIQTACGISGEINLADCKIWLETTEDKVAYAKMAKAGEVSVSTETTLESGKTDVRADATISNGLDGTVTIDKGSDGTVDITVKLPQAGSIEISADGKITVPAGGKVQATGGKEITLSNGGTVDTDGTVGAEKITVGDTTVTAPEGGKVTSHKAGNITVPTGGTVQITGGQEITLPSGGTVDKTGNVEAEKIISGDITATAPAGGSVTADKDGNITVPAGGTVQTGDGEEITLPDGGMVDADGNIIEQSFDGSGTPEDPYQIKSEENLKKLAELVNSGKDAKKACYKIEAEEGITLTAESSPWMPIGTAEHPFTGTFDGNGKTIKGLEISGGEPKDNQGLFGVNAGTIENLIVEGSVTGKDNVGGIAGTNNGTITGCTNKGSVTGKANVGGIAGTNGENGKVKDNVNSGNVVGDITGSGSSTIGALIGKNDNTNVAGDITGNYYQKTDGINKDLTGIGGTEQDPAGITSGSSPTLGGSTPSPTPGGTTPSPTPGGSTPSPTPGGSTPSPIPGESTPSPTPGGSTPSPTPGGSTPSPTPGGTTPSPAPEETTPSPTPGGATPSPAPGGSTPSPAPGGSTPSPAPGGSTPSPAPEQQEKVNQIAKELNVPVETAKKLQEMAQELGIETDTLLLTDQDIVNQTSEGDVKGSFFAKIQAKAAKAKKNSITVKWTKVKGAGGYQIYAAKCGKNSKYKLVKTIKKTGTTSFTYKKLKKGTGYRFVVRAYKDVDGKKYTVAASKAVHEVTEGGKRTNPKSIKVNKGTVKMKVGKKFTIKSKIVKANSGKKLSNHRKLSYESTNKEVAAVSKKGVIQGRKAGTCYIYVYAENGIFKKIKATVKK